MPHMMSLLVSSQTIQSLNPSKCKWGMSLLRARACVQQDTWLEMAMAGMHCSYHKAALQ